MAESPNRMRVDATANSHCRLDSVSGSKAYDTLGLDTTGECSKCLKVAAGRRRLNFNRIYPQTVIGGGKSIFEKTWVIAGHNLPTRFYAGFGYQDSHWALCTSLTKKTGEKIVGRSRRRATGDRMPGYTGGQ